MKWNWTEVGFSFNQFRENFVQQTKMWTKTKIFVHFRNLFEHFAIRSKLSRNLFEIFAKFDRNFPDIRKIEKFSWKWGRKFRRIHRNSRGFWTKMNEFCSFVFANFVQRKFRWNPKPYATFLGKLCDLVAPLVLILRINMRIERNWVFVTKANISILYFKLISFKLTDS